MKKNTLRTVFSLILALFLSIVLLSGIVLGLAAQTVCSPEYLRNTAKSSGYAAQLYEEIKYQWENFLAITGVMEPEPIMAVLTPEQVEADALHYLDTAFDGAAELNTDELKAALEGKIRQYVENYYPSSEQKEEMEKNIRDLVADCISCYRSAISIPGIGYLFRAVKGVQGYFLPAALILVVAGIGMLVFLFILQERRTEMLYYGVLVATTDAVFLLGIPALAHGYRVLERLPLGASALKTLLQRYLAGVLDWLKNAGWIAAICAVALLLVYVICCAVRKTKKDNEPQNIKQEIAISEETATLLEEAEALLDALDAPKETANEE